MSASPAAPWACAKVGKNPPAVRKIIEMTKSLVAITGALLLCIRMALILKCQET
jgi:hypothetical protein